MARKRYSKVWTTPLDEFKEIIASSVSTTEALAKFGLENKGGNNRTIWSRIKDESIDTSHFRTRGRSTGQSKKIPDELVFRKDSSYKRNSLKQRIISQNIIKYECQNCNNPGIWDSRKLSLQLDHINGISNDNRIDNLRFLCPNCHSQTETFAGKNTLGKRKRANIILCSCGKPMTRKSKTCSSCRVYQTKIVWPDKNTILSMISNSSFESVARKLGVSSNAIRKYLAE